MRRNEARPNVLTPIGVMKMLAHSLNEKGLAALGETAMEVCMSLDMRAEERTLTISEKRHRRFASELCSVIEDREESR